MKFGFQVMLRGAASSGDGLASIARSGELFGFDIIAPNLEEFRNFSAFDISIF